MFFVCGTVYYCFQIKTIHFGEKELLNAKEVSKVKKRNTLKILLVDFYHIEVMSHLRRRVIVFHFNLIIELIFKSIYR